MEARSLGVLFFSWTFSACCIANAPVSSIFVHGLGGSWKQSLFYAENNTALCGQVRSTLKNSTSNWYILKAPVYSFDFPHVHNKPEKKYVSLAQNLEIAALKETCDAIQGPKILMGVSMGASTIINYTSLYYTSEIKALILETPFDDPDSVLKHKSGFLYDMIKNSMYMWFCPLYNHNGIKPISAIRNFPKNLPILLIHASSDELIPPFCSRHLYHHLKENGNQHVYLLELSHGKHANYLHGKDAQKYQETVHAFCKKYNLPHDEALALSGKKYLDNAQPWY
ncbi:hypothetical protein CVU75_00430 [Candidatus Dependentiae bacterium HGW-Dependentiae-1]|nr:MAG: hypothetical protein CVU75_00430 [Candidatus Dependentiae bacterium HGW-Dependentiae-1]